jgi:hypothetical protein
MLFAACGSGSDEPGDAVDTAPTTTAGVTTTTTVETTTTSTTTTSTSTSTSSTTLAPTTTLSPEQQAIAAAEEALVKAFEAKTAALVDPAGVESRRVVSETWTEPSLSGVVAQLDMFVRDGLALRISEDPQSFVEVVGTRVLVSPEQVDLTFCRLDVNVVVLDELVGGIEAVVDDVVTTRIWRGTVLLEEELWRFSGAVVEAEADGEVECEELLP